LCQHKWLSLLAGARPPPLTTVLAGDISARQHCAPTTMLAGDSYMCQQSIFHVSAQIVFGLVAPVIGPSHENCTNFKANKSLVLI
jgi:hypothetical protein